MKINIFIIGTMVCIIGLMTACNNIQTTTDGEDTSTLTATKQEIKYNHHIQTQFFGFSFGDSPQEVKKKLVSAGLYTNDRLIPNGQLSFQASYPQDVFAFGGFSWNYCKTEFSNNRLYAIEFMNPFKTKNGAAKFYNNLLNSLSQKYYMQIENLADWYGTYVGRTFDNQIVVVSYYKYESFRHEIWYGASLLYMDYNYYQENDEL